MLGKPKYDYGELVEFSILLDNIEYSLVGKVYIIDAYGTFEQNKDVSYDIMVEESPLHNGGPCLYKHLIETRLHKITNHQSRINHKTSQ